MRLQLTVGQAVSGDLVVADLAELPNLLVAGSADTGMNEWVHGAVAQLCSTLGPENLQLLVLNPDGTQLHRYKDCQHLSRPVCVSTAEMAAALEWAVGEMNRRFDLLAAAGVRNIKAFNKQAFAGDMPYLLIVVDDLAGLMGTMPGKTEVSMAMLSCSRPAGIHRLVATQKPEASVLTGVILANCPARVAFKLDSEAASHLVLEAGGAENLNDARDLIYRAHITIKFTAEDVSRLIAGPSDAEKTNDLREILCEPNESSPCIPLRMAERLPISAACEITCPRPKRTTQHRGENMSCRSCNGSRTIQCPICRGTRKVNGKECPSCKGVGKLVCPTCGGTGK